MPKKSTNLTLSAEALRMANALKKILHRPSISNLVESLIVQAHAQEVAPANCGCRKTAAK